MRVAAWYSGTPDQSSPKSENKCRLARPITLPNFVALRQKCARYPLWEIFSPGKLNQRSPKSLKICYAPMPLSVPNFIALDQTMYEKSATKMFYTLQYFGAPGDSLGQSSRVLELIYSKAHLSICQISSHSDNLSTRYLLPNFVDFVENVTDKNSKRHVSS